LLVLKLRLLSQELNEDESDRDFIDRIDVEEDSELKELLWTTELDGFLRVG
jgi:hypothetical protein